MARFSVFRPRVDSPWNQRWGIRGGGGGTGNDVAELAQKHGALGRALDEDSRSYADVLMGLPMMRAWMAEAKDGPCIIPEFEC